MMAMKLPIAERPPPCDPRDCPDGACKFSVPLVRLYLSVKRQAKILGEPFDLVLRNRTRNSRHIDPNFKGHRSDPYDACAIEWALDEVQRRHGIDVTNSWNADRVAEKLCPERWAEEQAEA